MTENKFVGTWQLVSFELRDDDGHVTYLYGKDTIGYIMYAEEGYVCGNYDCQPAQVCHGKYSQRQHGGESCRRRDIHILLR
ncbi:MAG: lipocalin-like domain-containing protein [Hormoscilla sp. SP5CHS1]|nr:lipocalin-like domain-containing protein [Hormoscilla sp. SP12CHS1]MBC6453185.1 lipocalin-like domain-containing protein [Hormoscilla sp. SP5CHS1]